jgi:hypothetical protein
MSRIHPIGAVLATASLVAATLVVSGITANADVAGDNYASAIAESGSNWTTTVSTVGATIETGEVVSTGDPALTRQTSVWLRWTATASGLATVSANSSDVATVGLAVFAGASVAEAKQLGFSATGSIENQSVQAGTTYLVQVTGIGAPGASTGGAVTIGLAGPGAKGTAKSSAARSGHVAGPIGRNGKALAPQVVIKSKPQLAPINDNFAGATLVTGAGFTANVDTTGATTQAHEPVQLSLVSDYTLNDSVWLKWKAPANGRITLDTDGSGILDTAIAIFSGSTMATAHRLIWNDQGGVSGDFARIVGFAVAKGVTYHFQLGDADGGPGNIFVSLTGQYSPPANDLVAKAITVSAPALTPKTYTGTDIGATVETTYEPVDNTEAAGFPVLDSVWWKWTAPADGQIASDTIGSSMDSYLGIFEQDEYGSFDRIGFSDQGFGNAGDIPVTNVLAGNTYYFQVGRVDGYQGSLTLHLFFSPLGPQITLISPHLGHLAGGNHATITGLRLGTVNQVWFSYRGINTLATNLVIVSPTKITFTVPAGIHRVTDYVWLADTVNHYESRKLGAPGYRYF